MARSLFERFVLIVFVAGCVILCCSGSASSSSLTFKDNTFISYEVFEGENVTIDCSTVEPAYYTALEFHHSPVPPFYLAPDGKKVIQKGQIFTIISVTQQNNGTYTCLVKDKQLQNEVLQVAEIILIPRQPNALDSLLRDQTPMEKTAAMKLTECKPYLYFKQKSPLRVHVNETKPLELSFSVKGLQPIKMQWKKDDHELMIGSRYKTFDRGRQLSVDPPFAEDDSGTYSVSACNSKGCAVKGVQVMFYVKRNNTQMIQKEGHETQDEGYIQQLLKKYGLLGIPTVLVIILIIAIACAAGSGGAPKEKKKRKKVEEITREIHIHKPEKNRGSGGRTASLWSWHSDGDSSPDEMPDYDRIKHGKKSAQRHHQESPQPPEHHYAEMHYGESNYEHTGQRQYSMGSDYDGGRHGESFSHGYTSDQHNYNTAQQTNLQGSISNDENIYDTIENTGYSGSWGSSINNERNKGANSNYNAPQFDRGYNNSDARTTAQDTDELVYVSYVDQMRNGMQPTRAQVMQNTEPAQATHAAQAYAHTVDIENDDEQDFSSMATEAYNRVANLFSWG